MIDFFRKKRKQQSDGAELDAVRQGLSAGICGARQKMPARTCAARQEMSVGICGVRQKMPAGTCAAPRKQAAGNTRVRAAVLFLCAAVAAGGLAPVLTARASSISELQQQKNETENRLHSAQGSLSTLEGQQEEVSDRMNEANADLVENMASVQLLEEQIEQTQAQIETKQREYDAARAKEEEQYEAMKKRIRFMYEKGDASYVQILMKSTSFGDMINKSMYIEQLYEYDRRLLTEYQETKQQVADAKTALENEKADQEASKDGLQEEQAALQAKLDEMQSAYDDFEARISQAQQEAEALKAQVKQQTAQISALQEEEARKAEAARKAAEEAARKKQEEEERKKAQSQDGAGTGAAESGDSGASPQSSDSGSGSNKSASSAQTKSYAAAGSASGQNVVNFATQFVGNPYVYGGTSLTNGADCSGFTMSVYKAFGYSLPRTAEEQRGVGTEVASLAEARPGDLVCYPGHVGIYCGNGTLVHASTAATGIKYSVVTYRPILCIRRVIN